MEDAKAVLSAASKMNGKPVEPEQAEDDQQHVLKRGMKRSLADCHVIQGCCVAGSVRRRKDCDVRRLLSFQIYS